MLSVSFLDSAIEAHTKWKIRLLTAINGGEVPDKATTCVDNRCDLGKWIYGEGARTHGQHPDFVALREAHKQFHACIGTVLDLLAAGNKVAAKELIMTGEYGKRSQEVVRVIVALKRLAA
ncbi:MAG: hypothetical protein RL385_2868 [Pseudomonadota bacterium]|jgi:methyl-accepting chemotaxis protein